MKAIIDEGVPRDLVRTLVRLGCSTETFPDSWKGTKNGQLLTLVEAAGFDCLVTCDKTMEWQQSLRHRRIALVILPMQKLVDLEALAETIAQTIAASRPGVISRVPRD